MIISKKRFNEEVEMRAREKVEKYEEYRYREDRDRERYREMRDLENRLIQVEKACGIDHPSHKALEAARAVY